MRHGTHCRRALRGFLAVAAIITLFGSGNVSAQRFEFAYGSPGCVEGGLHGVKQLAGGGYVAVGESFVGPGGACMNTSDAYVVVTNAAGGLLWSNTYQIGVNSRATDVLELPNGNLIVVGYTQLGQCAPVAGTTDIFVLELLNPGGAPINWNTYGSANTTEEAWKIIRTTIGDNITTFPGDYVIAGSSTNQNPAPNRGGYLLRINAGLGLIWDRQYGTANNDDYFYGVDEVPAGFVGAGDLVAVGGSTTPPALGTDIFTVRVNGNTSNIGLAPQGQSWTNFPPAASNEVGYSVIVLRNGPNAGDIVVAGYTTGAPAPSVNDEVFVVEFGGGNPCNQISNVYFGDNGLQPDRGYDLVEDANPVPPAGSDVVVTGFTSIPGGFGGRDVFLQRVGTGPGMGLLGPGGGYGGNGNDEGWSVANAVRNVPPNETPGYVVNGFTQSPSLIGPADPQQLYLFKTDLGLNTLCNRMIPFPNRRAPNGTVCGTALGPNIGLQCRPQITWTPWQWGYPVCPPPRPPANGQRGRDGNENDGVAGVGAADAITFNGGRMASYPNPLHKGDVLNLRLELKAKSAADVVISDIAGREVYHGKDVLDTGIQLLSVSTDGWASGTYIVRVTVDAATATSHVVVMDK